MFSPQKLAQGLMQDRTQPLNMVRGTGFQAPQTISYGPSSYTSPSTYTPTNTGLFGKVQGLLDMGNLAPKVNPNVNSLIPNYDQNGLKYNDSFSQDYYNQVKRPLYLSGPTNNAAINDISHQVSQAGPMGQLFNSMFAFQPTNDPSNSWSKSFWQQAADKLSKEVK